jgi:hypothetical protein
LPSFHSTASGLISQIIAARFLNSSTTFSAAWVVAMPVAKVTRLPPVRNEKPIELVSATIGRTRSTGMPRISAAMIAIEAREPLGGTRRSYRQSCRSIWVEPAPLRARSR